MNYAAQLRAAAAHYDNTAPDDDDRADELRDEYITEHAAPIAKALIGSEDFAWGVLVDQPRGAAASILQDAGRFFERMHNAPDDPSSLASHAVALYRDLLPYIEAAAKEQAEEQVAAEYDRSEAA